MRVNISYGRKDGKRLMKLSVIIVSYENCEILRDCLDSIKKFNDLKDEAEIIISDNSITNSVYEMVKKDYPEIQIIKNNNIGFGPANNRAVDISSGEYLLFLNPDTILLEPIFQFAVDKFEQQSNLALFGIKLMNVNGTANNSFFAMDNYTLSWTLLMKAFSKFDIYIDGKTNGEAVYIPVVLSKSGMTDLVYNDFYVEDGADVRIVAGCGIHNSGCNESRHDGIHTFHVGKNANVRYEEKHYGEGNGTGARVLNPVTNIFVGENSVFTLDTAQIKGVDSTVRETNVELEKDAKLYVTERLMTDGEQKAESNIEVKLNGEDSSAQIVSRSVGKGNSVQTFHPNAIGNSKCQAHIQCDSIIMDQAEVGSIPEIRAKNIDAAIIHEAAIGRINDEQLLKLRTLGLTEEEAEEVIIQNFLN